VRDNKQLWGQHYNRKLSDALVVQEEIAREITDRLRLRLTGAERSRVTKRYTDDPQAYQFYLKGRYYWNKRTPDNFRKAIQYFQQALDRDPNYALAYSGLADSYALLPNYEGASPRETVAQAKAAALKALQIDEHLAEGHASLGQILFYDYDFASAERELRHAVELNPNYASGHQWLGELLSSLGRHEEALVEVRRALELDPLSIIINRVLGNVYYNARRYDPAVDQFRKTIEMDPGFATAHAGLGDAYVMKGMYGEAIGEFAKAEELGLGGGSKETAAALLDAYAKGGWKGYLQHEVARISDPSSHAPSYFLARMYTALGEKDKAFAALEKDYEKRNWTMTDLKVDPALDSLRSDPRFADLLRRVGLP
jgi:tetratricopeptide (TPR) repeat protein